MAHELVSLAKMRLPAKLWPYDPSSLWSMKPSSLLPGLIYDHLHGNLLLQNQALRHCDLLAWYRVRKRRGGVNRVLGEVHPGWK